MFLITCPTHDTITHYLSNWSREIINFAKNKNRKVIVLNGSRVNRSNVEKILSKIPIKLIMFNGHGDHNLIAGHKDRVIIKSPGNEKHLKSKIIYSRSCKSAKRLGMDSVISGATAFIGYDDDFVFLANPQKTSKPLQDKIASKFLKPANTIILSLLKGNTVDDSYKRSQDHFKREIRDLLTSETSDEDMHSLPYLVWDMNHQIYHGDGNATY